MLITDCNNFTNDSKPIDDYLAKSNDTKLITDYPAELNTITAECLEFIKIEKMKDGFNENLEPIKYKFEEYHLKILPVNACPCQSNYDGHKPDYLVVNDPNKKYILKPDMVYSFKYYRDGRCRPVLSDVVEEIECKEHETLPILVTGYHDAERIHESLKGNLIVEADNLDINIGIGQDGQYTVVKGRTYTCLLKKFPRLDCYTCLRVKEVFF